jgi:hypothetical protein
MSSIEFIRDEIERLRGQIRRQQDDILTLRRSGRSTASAEVLLERMRASANGLCKKWDGMQQAAPMAATS